MFKRTSLMALLIGAFAFTTLPSAEVEAAGYKGGRSSSSSFRSSSSSRSSYSSGSRYSAPKSSPYSRPAAAVPRGGMRANDSTYRGQSATNGYRKPIQGMKSTPYGQRPSGYSSRYSPRSVSSPMSRSSYAPRNTTVINRNYYGSNRGSYGGGFGGYNRGHYGGGYGGGMGGPGLGSMLLAGAGGAILGNMLYNGFSHTPAHSGGTTRTTDTVTPVQADQIRQEQRIEDKLDQVNDKLDAQPTAMAGPQGYSLPDDAPLVMDPKFYQLGGNLE